MHTKSCERIDSRSFRTCNASLTPDGGGCRPAEKRFAITLQKAAALRFPCPSRSFGGGASLVPNFHIDWPHRIMPLGASG